MDRTKEYLYIVNSTNIPQQKANTLLLINTPQLTKSSLDLLYNSTEETNIYYTKLRKIEKDLEYKLIYKEYSNLQEEKVYNSIIEHQKYMQIVLKLQWQRCYDKLLDKKKKQTESRNVYIYDEESKLEHNTNQSLLMQETENVKKRDVIHEQIEEQITELGQIMCDISMHIQAQGECLKRLDDMVVESDTYLRRSVFEIQRTWKMVGGRRNVMVKVFGTFIAILFFIFIIRKFFG